jgi:hypothetical protein
MQPKSALESLDEELTHISSTAESGRREFTLVSITHRVSQIGLIQYFWPLDDISQTRRDIRASVEEQSGAQTLVFEYSLPTNMKHGSVVLTMADGSFRTATLRAGSRNIYEIVYSLDYWQDEYLPVSAGVLDSAIRVGDLARLKNIARTANALNMGLCNRPIHMAMYYDQLHILEWLLAQPGTDINKSYVGSPCNNMAILLSSTGVARLDHRNIQFLCMFLRAGLPLMAEDSLTGCHIFHFLAKTTASNVTEVMAHEDIAQKLLEHVVCALEPNEKVDRPLELYASAPPPFVSFLKHAMETLQLVVSVHIPIQPLTGIVVSYIASW